MTIDQITALTPEERNALIAKHLGWRHQYSVLREEMRWYSPNGENYLQSPNYSGSLDLMAEAEKTLTHDQCCKYHEWVDVFVAHSVEEMDGEIEYPADEFWFHAKAEQKAIAFLATVLNP